MNSFLYSFVLVRIGGWLNFCWQYRLTTKRHFLFSTLLEVFKMTRQNRFSGVFRTKNSSGSSNTIEPTEQENYRLILLGMQKVHGHLFQISEPKKSNWWNRTWSPLIQTSNSVSQGFLRSSNSFRIFFTSVSLRSTSSCLCQSFTCSAAGISLLSSNMRSNKSKRSMIIVPSLLATVVVNLAKYSFHEFLSFGWGDWSSQVRSINGRSWAAEVVQLARQLEQRRWYPIIKGSIEVVLLTISLRKQ